MTSDPVLILGGRSEIGLAAARRFAALGHPIQLAARDPDRLAEEQSDIALRHGVTVTLQAFDVLDTGAFAGFVEGLDPLPGIVVCAVGLLGDQAACEHDPAAATAVMRTNYEGPALILGLFAERFAARGHGTLVGISSVAGDRGRASNYVYGSAKAGFTVFLSGLRNRLAKRGVHVVTVKPGFVATRMTEGMDLPAHLTVKAETVADAIVRSMERRHDLVYVGPVWRFIMLAIRAIPERLFKNTHL